MTRNKITTDELIDALLSPEDAAEVRANVEANVKKWGGKRKNSGRKAKSNDNVLKFSRRISEKESRFLDYARAHNLNYDELMQG